MTNQNEPEILTEPSVWDYLLSKIKFRQKDEALQKQRVDSNKPKGSTAIPWLTIVALFFALIAQILMEPSSGRSASLGILLYTISSVCLIIAILRNEWRLSDLKPDSTVPLRATFKIEFLLIGILLGIFAFILFGNGMFGFFNTFVWVLSLFFIFLSFWQTEQTISQHISRIWLKFKNKKIHVPINSWVLIVLAVIAVILFFNFHRLDSVPPEMVSDHAEKLMDINDLINGNTSVYFRRNTGREVMHFYLTAAYMALFNLDVSFLNLKVVAVFANLLTLFFIYLLGKEVGNKWVGLSAAFFSGIAYWPLIFTRLALRIPYYPLFVAPVMYFILRGLRRQNIKDVLWAGIFLGLGLHGYTPFRIVPIFVVFGVIIYMFHKPGRNRSLESVFILLLIAFTSLIVFIPLLRYWLANPELFAYRAFSRLTDMEAGFQSHPILIFFQNFWKASVMFFWDNGVIWVHSIPRRPALEFVSGALYFMGIISLLIRYIRKRNWMDLFLLVSIPMMLMPSMLSLAFPSENPSLNRTAGAVVPVFVVIGLSFETLIRALRQQISGRLGRFFSALVAVVLVYWSAANNYDLVFRQYYTLYRDASWNTSEIGRVAALFIESIGSPETTYAVGYPHWVDSRLVAINAGYTGLDFAIMPDRILETVNDPRAKMFFVNMNDEESKTLLLATFPSGVLWQYDSDVANKDFMIFFVPPAQGVMP